MWMLSDGERRPQVEVQVDLRGEQLPPACRALVSPHNSRPCRARKDSDRATVVAARSAWHAPSACGMSSIEARPPDADDRAGKPARRRRAAIRPDGPVPRSCSERRSDYHLRGAEPVPGWADSLASRRRRREKRRRATDNAPGVRDVAASPGGRRPGRERGAATWLERPGSGCPARRPALCIAGLDSSANGAGDGGEIDQPVVEREDTVRQPSGRVAALAGGVPRSTRASPGRAEEAVQAAACRCPSVPLSARKSDRRSSGCSRSR